MNLDFVIILHCFVKLIFFLYCFFNYSHFLQKFQSNFDFNFIRHFHLIIYPLILRNFIKFIIYSFFNDNKSN